MTIESAADLPRFLAVQSPQGDTIHAHQVIGRTVEEFQRLDARNPGMEPFVPVYTVMCRGVRRALGRYSKTRTELDFEKHEDAPRPSIFNKQTIHTVCPKCASRVRRIRASEDHPETPGEPKEIQ